MKLTTLEQFEKIIEIFKDVSNEKIQILLESGLLADLCDVDINGICRDEFRKFCGLKPIRLPTLSVTISALDGPMAPSWGDHKLVKNSDSPVGTLKLELATFFKEGEQFVNGDGIAKGDVIVERAEKIGCLGQRHAQFLLDNQQLIPKEWQAFVLAFPNTVWQDPLGSRNVPYLEWYVEDWDLSFNWLDHGWPPNCLLVRPCK